MASPQTVTDRALASSGTPSLQKKSSKDKLLLGLRLLVAITLLVVIACPGISFYMRWASFAYLAMVIGLFLRKDRKLHVPLMHIAIVSDLALVLLLEMQRSAIKTATSFTMTVPQQLHIGFSTLAVMVYFPVLYLGWKRFRNKGGANTYRKHKGMGLVAFIFRTLGFFFMFSLIK